MPTFIEMQPINNNPENFINEFKMTEAKNLLVIAADPGKIKELKEMMLSLLIITVGKLKMKNQVSYHDFIPLYELVKISKVFNAQTYPRWDHFWRKRNTATMQTALGMVRNAATDILVEKVERLAPRDGAELIDRALEEKLFSEPRSNWAVLTPNSFDYLNSKRLDLYSAYRHSRGIYTPSPLDQMNGWPHPNLGIF
jgi:hypothetical protein